MWTGSSWVADRAQGPCPLRNWHQGLVTSPEPVTAPRARYVRSAIRPQEGHPRVRITAFIIYTIQGIPMAHRSATSFARALSRTCPPRVYSAFQLRARCGT
jgi:hypothetical protein